MAVISRTTYLGLVESSLDQQGLQGDERTQARERALQAWMLANGGSEGNTELLSPQLREGFDGDRTLAGQALRSIELGLPGAAVGDQARKAQAAKYPARSWYASLFRGKVADPEKNPGTDESVQSRRSAIGPALLEGLRETYGQSMSFATGTVAYKTAEDLDRDLFYLDIEPKGELKGTYLFVEGYQSTMKGYLPFVMKLVADGYRVRIYDQPSQGLSQRDVYPDGDRMVPVTGFVNDHTTYVNAFDAMLFATVSRYGQVGVMGHSLGGSNILTFMRQNIERAKAQISSVVLLNANVGLVDKFKRHVPVLGRMIRAYSDNYNLVLHDGLNTKRNPKLGELRLFGDVSHDIWMNMRETGTGWGLVQVEAQGNWLRDNSVMGEGVAEKINIPVLVVHSENDSTSKIGPTQAVVSNMFENPKMPRLKDGVHYPFLHVDTRDGVEATVKSFMANPMAFNQEAIETNAPPVVAPAPKRGLARWLPFLGALAFLGSRDAEVAGSTAVQNGLAHLDNTPALHLEDIAARDNDSAVVHHARRSVPHAARLQASAGRVAAVRAQQSNLVMRG